jgi:hypothetical protein
MKSMRAVLRVRGIVSVALTAAILGGCTGSAPTKPDGGAAGKDGGVAGKDGGAAGTGGAGTGGSPDGGTDSPADVPTGAAGTGAAGNGAAGTGAAGTGAAGTGAAGNGAAGTGGAGKGAAGTGGAGSGAAGAAAGADGGTADAVDGKTDGTGGASDASDAGDTGGVACGNVGQACCASGNTCGSDLLCLGGASCSCAKALLGRYLLRADGTLLFQADSATGTNQTAVLDANTALPLAGIVDAMEGYAHGCAVLADHTAWCWRSAADGNNNGEMGSGVIDATGPLFRATKVLSAANQPLTNVVAISSADRFTSDGTCAVTGDGKVYCWGNDTWLTNGGTTLKSAYAIQITTDGVTPFTGALQVAVNGVHACAIVQGASTKEVWCWGNNGHGQLGTGDGTYLRYPKKVLGLTNPTKVITYGSEGYWGRTCALDGSNVRCWGANGGGYYALGNTSPTLVTLAGGATALGMVVDIQGASQDNIRVNTCARTMNNTVLCWGTNFGDDPVASGVTNVVSLGSLAGGTLRVLTSDGLYHIGTATRSPSCGPL